MTAQLYACIAGVVAPHGRDQGDAVRSFPLVPGIEDGHARPLIVCRVA
jgi:hypothetical protein